MHTSEIIVIYTQFISKECIHFFPSGIGFLLFCANLPSRPFDAVGFAHQWRSDRSWYSAALAYTINKTHFIEKTR